MVLKFFGQKGPEIGPKSGFSSFLKIEAFNISDFLMELQQHEGLKWTQIMILGKVAKNECFGNLMYWIFLIFCMKLQQYRDLNWVKWFQFRAAVILILSRNFVCCFKFIEWFIKITPADVKIVCGTKLFGKTFVLELISCLNLIRLFNSWLNEKHVCSLFIVGLTSCFTCFQCILRVT